MKLYEFTVNVKGSGRYNCVAEYSSIEPAEYDSDGFCVYPASLNDLHLLDAEPLDAGDRTALTVVEHQLILSYAAEKILEEASC